MLRCMENGAGAQACDCPFKKVRLSPGAFVCGLVVANLVSFLPSKCSKEESGSNSRDF